MGFLSDDDKDVPPTSTQPTSTQPTIDDVPLLPRSPWDPNEPLTKRAFGHPLGSDPTDPESVRKAGELVWKGIVDPLGKDISLVSPFIEPIAKTIGKEAIEEGAQVSKGLTGVGTAISVGGFLWDCGQLGWDTAKDMNAGIDPYHDQKIYNDMGGVASNGIHAILGGLGFTPAAPFAAAADALLTTGEVATDVLGKTSGALFGKGAEFDANSVEGGLLRYGEGDKSIGNSANEWVTDKLGGGSLAKVAGMFAGGVVNNNPVGWVWNTNNAVKDGVQSEVQAAQQGYNNGEGLMGMGKKAGLNPMGLPDGNPLLMALGLGGGNKSARLSAGMGGGVSSALSKPAEGGGGGPVASKWRASKPRHHLAAGLGAGISPLLAGAREGGGRGR